MPRKLRLLRRGWQIGRLRTRNKLIEEEIKIVIEFGRKVGFVSYMNPEHVDIVTLKYDLFYNHSASAFLRD